MCGLILALLVSLAVASDASRHFKSSDDWDHYIFVQQYPAGICAYNYAKGQPCDYSINASAWTIHGLWPTLGDSKGPNYCNNSATFNVNLLKDLLSRLNVEWISIINSNKPSSFWKHEWIKHGTCSAFTDEHTFFSTILDLFESMPFGKLFDEMGISPSHNKVYEMTDFMNAIKEKLGAYPYTIDCKYSSNSGQYLKQIGVCLDKSLKMMDCPSETSGSCKMGKSIHYPPSKYSHKL